MDPTLRIFISVCVTLILWLCVSLTALVYLVRRRQLQPRSSTVKPSSGQDEGVQFSDRIGVIQAQAQIVRHDRFFRDSVVPLKTILPIYEIETDYLVIGAGAMALTFVDELVSLAQAEARCGSGREIPQICVVEKLPRSGGHWQHAYPFVKLHNSSALYGVGSRALEDGKTHTERRRHRATKQELLDYFTKVEQGLREKGVRFFFGAEYLYPEGSAKAVKRPQGAVDPGREAEHMVRVFRRSSGEPCSSDGAEGHSSSRWRSRTGENECLDGFYLRFKVQNKIVDGTWSCATEKIPKENSWKYTKTGPGAQHLEVVPVARMTSALLEGPCTVSGEKTHFVVVGAGKTGFDAIGQLLELGIPPKNIQWVMPRDYWFTNRHMLGTALPWKQMDSLAESLRDAESFGKNVAKDGAGSGEHDGWQQSSDVSVEEKSVRVFATNVRTNYFLREERKGVFLRINENILPTASKNGNISSEEMEIVREVDRAGNIIRGHHLVSIEVEAATEANHGRLRGQLKLRDRTSSCSTSARLHTVDLLGDASKTLVVDCSASQYEGMDEMYSAFRGESSIENPHKAGVFVHNRVINLLWVTMPPVVFSAAHIAFVEHTVTGDRLPHALNGMRGFYFSKGDGDCVPFAEEKRISDPRENMCLVSVSNRIRNVVCTVVGVVGAIIAAVIPQACPRRYPIEFIKNFSTDENMHFNLAQALAHLDQQRRLTAIPVRLQRDGGSPIIDLNSAKNYFAECMRYPIIYETGVTAINGGNLSEISSALASELFSDRFFIMAMQMDRWFTTLPGWDVWATNHRLWFFHQAVKGKFCLRNSLQTNVIVFLARNNLLHKAIYPLLANSLKSFIAAVKNSSLFSERGDVRMSESSAGLGGGSDGSQIGVSILEDVFSVTPVEAHSPKILKSTGACERTSM